MKCLALDHTGCGLMKLDPCYTDTRSRRKLIIEIKIGLRPNNNANSHDKLSDYYLGIKQSRLDTCLK